MHVLPVTDLQFSPRGFPRGVSEVYFCSTHVNSVPPRRALEANLAHTPLLGN